MDIEISSTIESDGVVEKAEAYAKELDDVSSFFILCFYEVIEQVGKK